MPGESENLRELIRILGETSYGAKISDLREFLKKLQSKLIHNELLELLFQGPKLWEEVRNYVWPNSEEQQLLSKYNFLQGDIVQTTAVFAVGIADSAQIHNMWMILSPDCDAVRSKWVRVAGVYKADSDPKDKDKYRLSLKFQSPKYFPVPQIPGYIDTEPYFVDLETPFYISDGRKGLASQLASMTVNGWHLLNAVLQEKETRAFDREEAERVRR